MVVQTNNNNNKLTVIIDNRIYDVTKWAEQHPGGRVILDHFNGLDASDAFHSLHSEQAHERLKKLHSVPVPTDQVKQPSAVAVAFREFRQSLVQEGWFDRNILREIWSHVLLYIFVVGGSALSYSHPILATFMLGIGMQQAGWLGHDLVHGRGEYCFWAGRFCSGLINAFSPRWWSEKHNTHHCFPNHKDVDDDIELMPIFYLWTPTKANDMFTRGLQHLYYPIVYAFIYVSWRWQSLQFAIKYRLYEELAPMLLNYLFLTLVLPWKVSLGSILFGGWLVAIVVTATHQSEDILSHDPKEHNYCFFTDQFLTTRDVICPDPISEYLWGGMNYQLEHHLFPTLPRYYYPQIRPKVMEFAKSIGLEYKVDSMIGIWMRNYATMHKNAVAPAISV